MALVKYADGRWLDTPVAEGPFYLALKQNSEERFNAQRELLLNEERDNEISWQEFLQLLISVLRDGFDCSKSPMSLSESNVFLDGQHRASILLDISGPDILLETNEKREVIALWAKLSV